LKAASSVEVTRRAVDAAGDRFSSDGLLALVAVGKASPAMAGAFADRVGRRIDEGIVIGTHCDGPLPPPLEWCPSSHPVPDERSVAAAERALALARRLDREDTLVVLVSGGTSALMAAPAAGLTLLDKQRVTRELLRHGADITSLNAVRKHLSAVKGGQLGASSRARVVAWLLSDVVGDDPGVIGSGPTVADQSTFADALAVLERHGGLARYPQAARERLEAGIDGGLPETPKPGDTSLAHVETLVIGSAHLSLEGAASEARSLGYRVVERREPVVGEARRAARTHADWVTAQLVRHPNGRLCLLSAGETTVHVSGPGKGGRNQEFALASVTLLAGMPRPVALASVGTDGVDGPTDTAGATVDGETLARGVAKGLDVEASLAANDSWSYFEVLGDRIVTGPTDTNVGDLQIVLVGERE
jgi:glycerate 2-kinase